MSLNSCTQKKLNSEASSKDGNEYSTEVDQKKEDETIYVRMGSCDDFISEIDFSSFCFSNGKTPKYRLVQSTDKSCQYQIYDVNGYHTIDFAIAFASFEGFNGNPEVAKQVFLKAFERKKNTRTKNQDSKILKNLGDEAYIGFNNKRDELYLGARIGNVSFTLVFHHGKTRSNQSCISDNKDIEQIGALVIDKIAKK